MKKIFFAFCTMAICLMATSCASDGCSVVGTWAVSDIKLESPTFAESMIGMMETEYRSTTYVFNADGTMSITSSAGSTAPGTYTADMTAKELKWKDNENQIENVLKILNCADGSVTLEQRMPADPSQELMVLATMTLTPKK